MKVNTTKTKRVTFQRKNKVNKSEIFRIRNYLSNVAEFVYLELKIYAAGSFKNHSISSVTKQKGPAFL